jgi:hypothetical protein
MHRYPRTDRDIGEWKGGRGLLIAIIRASRALLRNGFISGLTDSITRLQSRYTRRAGREREIFLDLYASATFRPSSFSSSGSCSITDTSLVAPSPNSQAPLTYSITHKLSHSSSPSGSFQHPVLIHLLPTLFLTMPIFAHLCASWKVL